MSTTMETIALFFGMLMCCMVVVESIRDIKNATGGNQFSCILLGIIFGFSTVILGIMILQRLS